ncbi:LppP/LprE family lipoprotein [Gemmobacter fulvus]|uniref:LppP/LprE family lipoprotein n=1 Tax=Gemmobacter fulvus TaxID=2840474 RepID=A0A975S2E1_9RHOB|nr:LppP/LprE family lipoprotein [Gemmobacter fulvus]MBT9243965.1 LppP/LprE family lipoprotein [Gemmobacter fulvus]MDQ1849176.1 LppP/LprE family lipoprotein [Gemmobacter fulvus]QWK90878.1 LppP/LprE family lipoprotein [Gemmobacter fulvus]
MIQGLWHALIGICLLASPALAQELVEVSDIPATVSADLAAPDTPDYVRAWSGDLTGDGLADLLVQAAYPMGGGNAAMLAHVIYQAEGTGFTRLREMTLPQGIKSARREGTDLVVTMFRYLPEDPHCCPSGEDDLRLPL